MSHSFAQAGRTLPPGPSGRLLLGNLPELVRDWAGFLTRCVRDYGDVVYLRVPGLPMCVVTHPDGIESVLVTNQANFRKAPEYEALRLVLGNGLLTNEGEDWRRQRRLIQPAFQRDQLVRYAEVMTEEVERMMAEWRPGEVRDVHAEMMGLTLRVVARSLFGADVSADTARVGEALDVVMARYNALAGLSLFVSPKWAVHAMPRARRAVRQLDDIVYRIVRERRASGRAEDDLLDRLLRARDDEGRGMTDRQLRDEVMTLFLAGHETTALALSWTWYLLAQHPRVEARLAEELDAVLTGAAGAPRSAAFEDVDRLPYTGMVLRESMRLYPPVYAIGRRAMQPFDIGPYHVPAGTAVYLAQWITQRDQRFYDEPERFIPERWEGDPIRHGRLPRFAYFPFGAGPRVCVGAGFAMMEATVLLAAIARRFRLELVPGQLVEMMASVTLRPKRGIRMLVRER